MTRRRAAAAALATIEALPRAVFSARERLALSQREVAEAAGVVRPYVSNVERGRVEDVPVTCVLALLRWLDAVDVGR